MAPRSAPLDDRFVVRSRRAGRAAAKAEKYRARAAEADRSATAKEAEIREKERAERDAKPEAITGFTVKRYLGIARIVVPVVMPLIYQGVGALRAQLDETKARRLGVAPDELAEFSGRGAALYARIHNLALSVRELQSRRSTVDRGEPADVRAFAADAEERLSDLEAAVRAAEQMPSSRRRSAHEAAGRELDRLEAAVLEQWGLTSGARAVEA